MKNAAIALILSAIVLAACSNEQASQNEASESPDDLMVNRSAPETSARVPAPRPAAPAEESERPLIEAPRIRGQAEASDGSGMDLIIYAADRREYQESLQLVAEQSTDSEFQQLDAALRYLMINDPSIMNDEKRLFEFINGKTGEEILQATANLLDDRAAEEG